ncbi:apolipoprotein A-IV precursor [Alligator mississippiensis]|uniref:Apolipoprotein A-IV n=1 Tax=Alligator mississippiensis TaxID=8496 RepID=A0A151LZQ0_ALLMI|nr:apolipoprotein A-IV precursor [Alligator mississippiensis]
MGFLPCTAQAAGHSGQPTSSSAGLLPSPTTRALQLLRMSLKTLALALALLAVAGSHAELDTELDAQQVANIVWSYFTDMRSSAQDTMDQIQESKLSKQINTLLQDKFANVQTYMADLQQKLIPFTAELQARMSQDSEKLKEQIRQELEELRAKLSPYADDVHQQITRNIQEMQKKLAPYAEQLRGHMDQNAEQLRQSLAPYAQKLQDQLQDNAGNLQAALAPYADQLQEQINSNVEGMKDRLASVTEDLKDAQDKLARQGNGKRLRQTLEGLGERMDRIIDDFRQHIAPHGEAFNQKLVQKLEELRQKLGSLKQIESSPQDEQ